MKRLLQHTAHMKPSSSEKNSPRGCSAAISLRSTATLEAGKHNSQKACAPASEYRNHVVSPSFTILNEYAEGKYPVYHFDFYRLRSLSELAEFGFEEYLFGDGICLLEWANIVASTLPLNRYDVALELGEGQSQRVIHIAKANME